MGASFGSKETFVIDHSRDDIPLKTISSVTHGKHDSPDLEDMVDKLHERILETPQEKKSRKRSHWVAYSTTFIMSIGFSIVLSGVWPYLQQLNPNMTKENLGWVVAANPLGQMLASPLVGWWGNKLGSIRWPCISTIIFFIFGNILYSLLSIFSVDSVYYIMIFSRFIVGVSSANVSLCRSYLAGATTLKERTVGITIVAAGQALGFVVGPAIQTVLTLTIPNPIDTGSDWFIFDKYTAAGWVAAAFGVANMMLFLPGVFQEVNIAEKENALNNKTEEGDIQIKLPNPDYIGVIGLLFGFFICQFIYVLLETLAVPFVQDQYAWNDDTAVVTVGIALSVGGILSTLMFVVSSQLAKRFDERKVMIIIGFIPLVVGNFLFLPWSNVDIKMQNCTDSDNVIAMTKSPMNSLFSLTTMNTKDFSSSTFFSSSFSAPSSFSSSVGALDYEKPTLDTIGAHVDISEPLHPILMVYFKSFMNIASHSGAGGTPANCTTGCPTTQEWCLTVPQLPLAQLAVAYITVILGYPVALGLSQAIFSKMLGPKPQGTWMGILTGVGSFSRVMGPIFVSYVYANLGTYWTFGILEVGMILAMIDLLAVYGKLVPMKVIRNNDDKGIDGPAAKY